MTKFERRAGIVLAAVIVILLAALQAQAQPFEPHLVNPE